MSARYRQILDALLGASIHVEFTTDRNEVTSYSVVLLLDAPGGPTTVRVYDGAHGFNELHRYTRRGGKQAGEVFHRGTLGEGMRAAIAQIDSRYQAMIESWRES